METRLNGLSIPRLANSLKLGQRILLSIVSQFSLTRLKPYFSHTHAHTLYVILGAVEKSYSIPRESIYRYRGRVISPIALVSVEWHSLGLGVSISPLVPLVSVKLHSLGLGS